MLPPAPLNIICEIRGEPTPPEVPLSSPLSRRRLLGQAARGVLGASLGAGLSLRALARAAQVRRAISAAGFTS